MRTITQLAVWTVTYDVISDQSAVTATNVSALAVADTAGEAIVQAMGYLAETITGGHAAITGAAIRRNDPLNSDVFADTARDSVVGLVDLQF